MSLISSLSNSGIPWFSSIIIAIVWSCLKMSSLLYTWLLYPLITSDSFVLAVSHINCKILDMILLLSFLARRVRYTIFVFLHFILLCILINLLKTQSYTWFPSFSPHRSTLWECVGRFQILLIALFYVVNILCTFVSLNCQACDTYRWVQYELVSCINTSGVASWYLAKRPFKSDGICLRHNWL